mmetsp:Transcript_22759/g.63199  ORF Transcript_22759/g.63199 Transcript_22759/m.63199 type:complete len:224 (+) Transcript_22759:1204-1875(+)
MHEEHGGCTALLPLAGIGILVALPCNVVHVGDVRAKDLPVEACILQLDLAIHVRTDLLGDPLAACEEGVARAGLQEHLVHSLAWAVEQVHISEGHAAVMEQAQVLLRHHTDLGVDVQEDLVAHVEGTHQLQDRDLEGEVEGRDERHRAKWPPHAVAHLPRVIPSNREATGEESHLVTAEVLQEPAGDGDLPVGLWVALWCNPLDEPREELLHLRFGELPCGLG